MRDRSTPELEDLLDRFIEDLQRKEPGRPPPDREQARMAMVRALLKLGMVQPVIGQPLSELRPDEHTKT